MNSNVPDERMREAGRCYNCGVPFCQSGIQFEGKPLGCPLHNLIPEWNDMLRKGNAAHALSRLLKVNCFPELTGRVCPAMCQSACARREIDGPVTIRDNELFLAEYGFENGLIVPHPPETRSGCKAAVIGSGPMGLAAAWHLNRRGHSVTVFEKASEPGGQLITKIPEKRLPLSVVKRRVELMEKEGVVFKTGVEAEAEKLAEEYDSVSPCADGGNRLVVYAIAAGKRVAAAADQALMGWTCIV